MFYKQKYVFRIFSLATPPEWKQEYYYYMDGPFTFQNKL